MKCGMVGLPNAGKSTLFNALMEKAMAHAANFPFCTIEPNVGQVPIKDERLQKLSDIAGTHTIIPTTLDCVDIAGLIKGASQGEGLGNQFLANIRNVDLILHVVRMFPDTFANTQATPLDDISIIETELALADIQILEKQLHKSVARTNPHVKLCQFLLGKLQKEEMVSQEEIALWNDEEKAYISRLGLITIKPKMYVLNIDESDIGKTFDIESKLKYPCVKCCAKLQDECNAIEDLDEREMWLSEYNLDGNRVDNILVQGYKMLNLITYFTAGEKEVRAWQIQNGTKAPQAAGKIHTDFERGFICAEVISYSDFIEFGGWSGCKTAGKIRREGKAYTVQDGDVCLFRYNV